MENIGYLVLFFLGLGLGIFWAEVKHKPIKYMCKECGKLCRNKGGLGSHRRIHRHEDTSPCGMIS